MIIEGMDQAWLFGFLCGAVTFFILQIPILLIIEKMRAKRVMKDVYFLLTGKKLSEKRKSL